VSSDKCNDKQSFSRDDENSPNFVTFIVIGVAVFVVAVLIVIIIVGIIVVKKKKKKMIEEIEMKVRSTSRTKTFTLGCWLINFCLFSFIIWCYFIF
jgi:hypothetical protein